MSFCGLVCVMTQFIDKGVGGCSCGDGGSDDVVVVVRMTVSAKLIFLVSFTFKSIIQLTI